MNNRGNYISIIVNNVKFYLIIIRCILLTRDRGLYSVISFDTLVLLANCLYSFTVFAPCPFG